jgi:hypothetical protein
MTSLDSLPLEVCNSDFDVLKVILGLPQYRCQFASRSNMGIVIGMQTNILSAFRQRTLFVEGISSEEIRSYKTVGRNGLEVYLSIAPVDGESTYPRSI